MDLDSFVKAMIEISGVSEQYANAAFFTLSAPDNANPFREAKKYCTRFNLI